MKTKYTIQQLDTWNSEDGWWVNEAWNIGEFETRSDNVSRAFLNAMRKLGIAFKRGAIRVEWDGDIYYIMERKTNMPIFDAVPMY